jgi:hypothetical protein
VQVFLYGTLLDPAVLAAQAGRRGLLRAARPARLLGWRRVRLRRAPFPTLLRARRGVVDGMLLRLQGAPLHRLGAYEGRAYRLAGLRLLTASGRRRGLAWIAAPSLADPRRRWPPAGTREIVTASRRCRPLARPGLRVHGEPVAGPLRCSGSVDGTEDRDAGRGTQSPGGRG